MVDAPRSPASGDAPPDRIRLDKWLWQARFFKSRALAAELAGSGRLRLNRSHVTKPSQPVRPGDELTFPQGTRIRVIRIEALGQRRGPATEARALYTDLEPPAPVAQETGGPDPAPPAPREPGAGRPTKKERRATEALREAED